MTIQVSPGLVVPSYLPAYPGYLEGALPVDLFEELPGQESFFTDVDPDTFNIKLPDERNFPLHLVLNREYTDPDDNNDLFVDMFLSARYVFSRQQQGELTPACSEFFDSNWSVKKKLLAGARCLLGKGKVPMSLYQTVESGVLDSLGSIMQFVGPEPASSVVSNMYNVGYYLAQFHAVRSLIYKKANFDTDIKLNPFEFIPFVQRIGNYLVGKFPDSHFGEHTTLKGLANNFSVSEQQMSRLLELVYVDFINNVNDISKFNDFGSAILFLLTKQFISKSADESTGNIFTLSNIPDRLHELKRRFLAKYGIEPVCPDDKNRDLLYSRRRLSRKDFSRVIGYIKSSSYCAATDLAKIEDKPYWQGVAYKAAEHWMSWAPLAGGYACAGGALLLVNLVAPEENDVANGVMPQMARFVSLTTTFTGAVWTAISNPLKPNLNLMEYSRIPVSLLGAGITTGYLIKLIENCTQQTGYDMLSSFISLPFMGAYFVGHYFHFTYQNELLAKRYGIRSVKRAFYKSVRRVPFVRSIVSWFKRKSRD